MTTPDVTERDYDRVFVFGPGSSEREEALDKELQAVQDALQQIALKHENLDIMLGDGSVTSVAEGLQNIDLMLDAQGWTNIFEYDDDRGLTLKQVKEASRQIRELLAANPFIVNAARIRHGQTAGAGVDFASRNRTGDRQQEVQALPVNIQQIIDSPRLQRFVFGNKARGEMERAAFSDGNIFLLGEDATKQMIRVQLQEITGVLYNPNNSEEVWAYRREWTPDWQSSSENPKKRVRWYYTDLVPQEDRRRTVQVRNNKTETAELGYTMLDISFNRQVGWAFGVPDALCVVAWSRLYKEFLVNGYVMSRSLARIAYKITVASTKGGENSATTVAAPGQAGGAYVEGSGNQLTPLATAGRGYDFASGNGLAGAIAAGLGVSLTAMLANSGTASGSNAAERALDPIAKATAIVRRKEWEDEFIRIFRYLGMSRRLVVVWKDMPEDTIQRMMQAITLADNMEVFDGPILQTLVADLFDIVNPGKLPSWWKPASQRKSAQSMSSTAGGAGSTDGSGQGDGERPDGDSQDDHDDDEA